MNRTDPGGARPAGELAGSCSWPALAACLALLALTLLALPLLTGQLMALAALRAALAFLVLVCLPGYALVAAAGVPGEGGLRLALAPAAGSVAAALFHSLACALFADRLDPLALIPALPVAATIWLWRRGRPQSPGPAMIALMPAAVVLFVAVLLVSISLHGFGAEGPEGYAFPTCGPFGSMGQYQLRVNLTALYDSQVELPFPAFSGLTMPYYHLFPAALDSLFFRVGGVTALTVVSELRPVYCLVVLVSAAWALLRVLGLRSGEAALGSALVAIGSEGLPLMLGLMLPHAALGFGVFAAALALAVVGSTTERRALILSALLFGALLQISPALFVFGGGGLAIVAVLQWLRHQRHDLLALGIGALILGLLCAGIQLLRTEFQGGGPDFQLAPLMAARRFSADAPGGLSGIGQTLGQGVFFLLALLNVRWIGLVVWARGERDAKSPVEWWLMATALLSLAASLVLDLAPAPALVLTIFPMVGLGCLSVLAVLGFSLALRRHRWLVLVGLALGCLGAILGSSFGVAQTVVCSTEERSVVPYALAGGLAWIREHTPASSILLAPSEEFGPGLLAERVAVAWLPKDHDAGEGAAVGMGFLETESVERQLAVRDFYQTLDARRASEILARYRVDLVLTTPRQGLRFPVGGLLRRRFAAGGYAVYSVSPSTAPAVGTRAPGGDG